MGTMGLSGSGMTAGGARVGAGMRGLKELTQTLNTLATTGAKRAAKAGLNSSLAALLQGMKAAINAAAIDSPHAAELKAIARKALGKRLEKQHGGTSGKAGFGVGKGKALQRKLATAAKRHLKVGGAGVGISASNIHWFVLGTRERDTGMKTHGRGAKARQVPTGRASHPTGRIQPLFGGVIASAVEASQGAMIEAARAKVEQVLAAEAAKARKG